jgi:hypothetical protein
MKSRGMESIPAVEAAEMMTRVTIFKSKPELSFF